MFLDCALFDNGEFYGLQAYTEEKLWMYYEYFTHNYSDFVIDCLNGNHYSVAAGSDPGIYESNVDKWYENRVETSRNTGRERDANYDVGESFADWLDSQKPIFLERLRYIEEDLEKINIDFYKKAVETIYINDIHPQLAPREKYYIYLLLNRSKELSFSSTATIGIDSRGKTREIEDAFSAKQVNTCHEYELNERHLAYDAMCELLMNNRDVKCFAGPLYQFPSFHDTFVYLFNRLIADGLQINKCNHCNRYFVPQRKDAKYCDMLSPEDNDKSCGDYMRYQKYLTSTHTEAARLYKQIYNQMANKLKRSGDTQLSIELDDFLNNSYTWKADVKAGKKSEDEYVNWLKSTKEGVVNGDDSKTR